MVSSLESMVITFLRPFFTCDPFHIRYFTENKDSNSIFLIFHLNMTIVMGVMGGCVSLFLQL